MALLHVMLDTSILRDVVILEGLQSIRDGVDFAIYLDAPGRSRPLFSARGEQSGLKIVSDAPPLRIGDRHRFTPRRRSTARSGTGRFCRHARERRNFRRGVGRYGERAG